MYSTMWHSIAEQIERISDVLGKIVAWLILVMVAIIVFDVSMRYLFLWGSVALQELEWHLFALVFLLAAAYTLKQDDHVRVDIFYRGRSVTDYHRAWIDLLGTLLFLMPFCALIIYTSVPFVYNAYVFVEGSPDPGGLPYRYLLKLAIPVSFGLLSLQGIAIMIRALRVIRSHGSAGRA